jgi:transcriptional regulator with XRE-family HTH domain
VGIYRSNLIVCGTDMNAREIVAWNVRRLRVLRGLSSEALASNATIDRSYMGRLERGQANPTVGMLERISRVLRVEIAELFDLPEPYAERPPPLPGGRRRRNSS